MNSRLFLCTLLSSVLLPICAFSEVDRISQKNETFPSDLYISGAARNPSLNIIYPGLSSDSSLKKIALGYLHQNDQGVSYMSQPSSDFDLDRTGGYVSPYFIVQLPVRNISSGLYLGDFISDFSKHTKNSSTDSVNNFNKNEIALDGSIWAATSFGPLRGISFWANGNYTHRDMHFENLGDWKSLHSIFNYKRKSGNGIISALFQFKQIQYACARIEYGKDIITAAEYQLDTLFFTSNSYVSSDIAVDSSFSRSLLGVHLDYLIKPVSYNWLSGIRMGANRSNIDFHESSGDSTQVYFNVFFQKQFTYDPFSIYSGASARYSSVFYNRSPYRMGYFDLANAFTWGRSASLFLFKTPFVCTAKVGSHFSIFGGAQFKFQHWQANYNFYNNILLESSSANYSFELLPIGVEFYSKKLFSISLTPSLDNKFFISGLNISFAL